MRRRCTPARKKKCAAGCGEHLAGACATCPDREVMVSPWFEHIDKIYTLQRGGYPFSANDLTLEEWNDLGVLRAELERPT